MIVVARGVLYIMYLLSCWYTCTLLMVRSNLFHLNLKLILTVNLDAVLWLVLLLVVAEPTNLC